MSFRTMIQDINSVRPPSSPTCASRSWRNCWNAVSTQGWTDDGLNDHFKTTRQIADQQSDRQTLYFGNFEFLDVGCSPGGFSARVLEKNRYASGVGISLPPSMGGYEFGLERRLQLRQRYRLIEQDILAYDLHHGADGGTGHPFPEDLCARFALVILDGHALRTYSAPGDSPDDPRLAQAAYRDALLIGQFIIGLSAVRNGGTVVVKLSHLECSPAAHLVYLLDAISDTLLLHKPAIMHSNRGTFYAIAKGVGHGKHADMKGVYLDGLRDLDFVVTADAILEDYLDRLVELGRGVWWTQVEGLRYFFRKKGIAM